MLAVTTFASSSAPLRSLVASRRSIVFDFADSVPMTQIQLPTTRSLRVGQDLDGVIYPFDVNVKAYLEFTGVDISGFGPALHWHFYRDWGYSDAEFVDICNRGVDAGFIFAVGDPFDDAVDAWRRIKEAGNSIHIATDRGFGAPGNSERNTLKYLADNGLEYDSITFTSDKTSVPVDVFIEDKLENYDALEAAGIPAFLITRPWNDQVDDRRRVSGMAEFADIITGVSVSN